MFFSTIMFFLIQFYFVGDAPVCDPKVYYECLVPAKLDFAMSSSSLCTCPVSCRNMLYVPVVSRAPLSDLAVEFIAAHVVNNSTPERVRKDYLTIHAYYPSLFLKQIKEKPSYSFMALLADIGGSMSLVLGGTVLTLCEAVDFFFSQMCPHKKARKEQRVRKEGSETEFNA